MLIIAGSGIKVFVWKVCKSGVLAEGGFKLALQLSAFRTRGLGSGFHAEDSGLGGLWAQGFRLTGLMIPDVKNLLASGAGNIKVLMSLCRV